MVFRLTGDDTQIYLTKDNLRHLFGDQPVEPGLEQVLVDLYDVRVSWFRLLASNRGF